MNRNPILLYKTMVVGVLILFIEVCIQHAFADIINMENVNKQPINGTFMKTFGGIENDTSYSIRQTVDGGYIITGVTSSFGVNGDVWVIKTDKNGRPRNKAI